MTNNELKYENERVFSTYIYSMQYSVGSRGGPCSVDPFSAELKIFVSDCVTLQCHGKAKG